MKNKSKLHILPIFIFMAVLTLSIKVNNVFDIYTQQNKNTISISTAHALAEEKINKETKELTAVFNKEQQDIAINPQNPNSSFTQSEILILQELAELLDALDVRSQ